MDGVGDKVRRKWRVVEDGADELGSDALFEFLVSRVRCALGPAEGCLEDALERRGSEDDEWLVCLFQLPPDRPLTRLVPTLDVFQIFVTC